MYTDEDLHAAVNVGILDENTADAFRKYVATLNHSEAADEENFQLVSGFNDIFVTIAALLLLISAAWLGIRLTLGLGFFIAATLSWLLSIHFVTKRRLALPAMVFLFAFVFSTGGVATAILMAFGIDTEYALTAGCAIGVLAAWLHWLRFRVPITVAAGLVSMLACVLLILSVFYPSIKNHLLAYVGGCGLVAFAVAMYWDAQDTKRNTRSSDVAFWLHMLAAPLIVHPVYKGLGIHDGEAGVARLAIIIGLYVLLALVSVIIDRRALMVSALVYVLYALTALLKTYGMVGTGFAVSGVAIGLMLLLLSAFWHKVRYQLLRRLPEGWRSYLPAAPRDKPSVRVNLEGR